MAISYCQADGECGDHDRPIHIPMWSTNCSTTLHGSKATGSRLSGDGIACININPVLIGTTVDVVSHSSLQDAHQRPGNNKEESRIVSATEQALVQGASSDINIDQLSLSDQVLSEVPSEVPPGFRRPSVGWLQKWQNENKKYALRERDRNSFRGSGWEDFDESGDYDPEKKKPIRLVRPIGRQLRAVADVADVDPDQLGEDAERQQPRPITYEQGRKIGRCSIVQLKFTSLPAMQKFESLAKTYPSKENSANEVLGLEIPKRSLDSGYGGSKSPLDAVVSVRARRKDCGIDGSNKLLSHTLENDYEDLLGHREARGCKNCYDLSLECSLVEHSLSYPCDHCRSDGLNCDLIITPIHKQACEQCKYRRLKCSNIEDGGGEGISCHNCQDANVICASGRAKSFRIDDVLASIALASSNNKPKSKAPAQACINCRKSRSQCSARAVGREGPCEACAQNGLTCIFGPVRRPGRPVRRKEKTANTAEESNESEEGKESVAKKYRGNVKNPNPDSKIVVSRPSLDDGQVQRKNLEITAVRRPVAIGDFSTERPVRSYEVDPCSTPDDGHLRKKRKYSEIAPVRRPTTIEDFNVRQPIQPYYIEDSDVERPEQSYLAGGKILNITTSFCHPITFNWVPPPPLSPHPYSSQRSLITPSISSFPCHFCTNPGITYALAGLGSKCVEVIAWDHIPQGYEEVQNGWVDAGEEGTKMCVECTTARMLIAICPGHIIRPIRSLNPRMVGLQVAIDAINEMQYRRITQQHRSSRHTVSKVESIKWCSICVMPATYECCVRPTCDKFGNDTSPDEDIGCGLLLCEVCAFQMTDPSQRCQPHPELVAASNGGQSVVNKREQQRSNSKAVRVRLSLDEYIYSASRDELYYPDGLRADVEFLCQDGELMRRLEANQRAAASEMRIKEEVSDVEEWADTRRTKRTKWMSQAVIDLTGESD